MLGATVAPLAFSLESELFIGSLNLVLVRVVLPLGLFVSMLGFANPTRLTRHVAAMPGVDPLILRGGQEHGSGPPEQGPQGRDIGPVSEVG